MNPIQILKDDHKEIKRLLTEVEEAGKIEQKKLFKELFFVLESHAKIEEEIFYPKIKRLAELKDITLESYEEHLIIDSTLLELNTSEIGTEQWLAKFKVLHEVLLHHLKEEEKEMLTKVEDAIKSESLDKIGQQMMDVKEKLTEVKELILK